MTVKDFQDEDIKSRYQKKIKLKAMMTSNVLHYVLAWANTGRIHAIHMAGIGRTKSFNLIFFIYL